MSKRQVLIVLGVLVMIFLFLGFPPEWDKILALVFGLLIIVVSFRIRSTPKPVAPDRVPYVEHRASTVVTPAPISSQATNTGPADTITSTDSTTS